MVEQKEFVTLFKIRKIDEDIELLIPYEVVEGIYNEENNTFMTPDGNVYQHIERTKYPEMGYARRIVKDINKDADEKSIENIDFVKKRKFNTDTIYKYLRYSYEPDKIYLKSKNIKNPQLMEDEDSKRYKEQQYKDEIDEQIAYIGIDKTPKEICELVKKTIKGQDEAIKTIVTCLWATFNSRHLSNTLTKKQIVLVGPTGVGKTAIWLKLKEILKIPVVIVSMPGMSQAGFTGRSTDEILKQVYFECNKDRDLAEKAIVILDEYDKLAYNGEDKSADVSTSGVQNELLKMVEGYTRVVEMGINGEDTFEIDTSNMIFIASGAFQELFEKKSNNIGFCNSQTSLESENINANILVKYGLKKESVGRFPIIVRLNELTREIYREIILQSDESELLAHIEFLEYLDVKVNNIEEVIELLIDDAMNKDIGARGLIATISNLFIDIIYEVANNPGMYSEIIIGKNIINNPKDFELIKRKIIKKTMKLNNTINKKFR